ncbi:hypothetical protein [Kitasatospora sp. NPDC057500]|uniref:hypothetical protein n=1 Tax=Kitasatospora sp. NPDC057500 TaxID=3346151 RepID=UPI00367472C4
MPRPAVAVAAAVQPDPSTGTGQTPAPDTTSPVSSPFWSRVPHHWVAQVTGDHLRAIMLTGDYARLRDGYCWAADRTLGEALDLHPDTVGKGLRRAEALGMLRSVQRSGGTSARVLVLPSEDDDVLWVCVSAYARNTLSGGHFSVYCVLSVRSHLDEPTSMGLIARLAGVGEKEARAAVADLVADGWITRADSSGRAARYTVHHAPIAGVPTQLLLDVPLPRQTKSRRCAPPAPAPHAEIDGQIALFDLDELAATPAGSTVTTPAGSTATTPAGSTGRTSSSQQDLFNRPRAVGVGLSGGADTAVPRVTGAPASTREAAAGPGRASAAPEPRTAPMPPLLITAAAYQVLAQAPGLVARMGRWEQREAARAIGRAIEDVDDVQRVADRLARRWATADPDDVRRPYGWLVRRGLVRRGCDDPCCESGWDTARQADCRTCVKQLDQAREAAAARRAQHRPRPVPAPRPAPAPASAPAAVPAPRRFCPAHRATTLPCALCQAAAAVPPAEPDAAHIGRAYREQLAARRLARESAADADWASRHGIA